MNTPIETEDYPVLYVLMRSDLPDYQPGKAMAQANHAGTQFMDEAVPLLQKSGPNAEFTDRFHQWTAEGDGFGTCVVLSATYPQVLARVAVALEMGFLSGVVLDPSYPIGDGHRTQHLPVQTCGWIFADSKQKGMPLLHDLRLFS